MRADSSAAESVESEDEEDGFHTGDEGEGERPSREVARGKAVEKLSADLAGLRT